MQQHINATHEAIKAAPAVGGATASVALESANNTLLGLPWSDVAAILTALYVSVQLGFFLHDRYAIWRSKRDSSKSAPPQS